MVFITLVELVLITQGTTNNYVIDYRRIKCIKVIGSLGRTSFRTLDKTMRLAV